MDLVAIVEPSKGIEPGHMVIGQELDDGSSRFFGYRFDPTELPAEFQTAERWQEYLFHNKTFGTIYEEKKYLQDLFDSGDVFFEKRAPCGEVIETKLPPPSEWFHYGDYSFSPDDFHSEEHPCYNCITWATMIGNRLVQRFLTPVRQGRIKLMVKQIRRDGHARGIHE
jgi:hypothetical protein